MSNKGQRLEITVYQAEDERESVANLVKRFFATISASRELAITLARRDIKAMYRQTVLGIGWAFLLPLVNTITWVFLNGSGIVEVSPTSIPYPAYVFAGTMIWGIIVESVSMPIQVLTKSKSILSKINFPKESLLMSGMLQAIFNGVIKMGLVIIAMIAMGIYPDWNILLLPVALIVLVLTGSAAGIVLAPAGMLYQDIGKSIPLIMQVFMYITPVVYEMPESGWTRKIFQYNPLTYVVEFSRNVLTGTEVTMIYPFLYVTAVVIVLVFLGWMLFRLAMPLIIERMTA